MAIKIIDTPVPVQRYLPRLRDIEVIIRYINAIGPRTQKVVTPEEARAIADAGKQLAIVQEGWGGTRPGSLSKSAGARDGRYARMYMPKIGAPKGAVIYYAVDADVLPGAVTDYFKEVAKAHSDGYYRVGVYGPGLVCKHLMEAGLVEKTWIAQSRGWRGYKDWKPHADLVQLMPTKIAGGLDVDPNIAQSDDWGAFTPFAEDSELTDLAEHEEEESNATVVAAVGGVAPVVYRGLKSRWTAWLGGGGAGTAVATTIAAEPEVATNMLSNPLLWAAIIIVALLGVVGYLLWKRK